MGDTTAAIDGITIQISQDRMSALLVIAAWEPAEPSDADEPPALPPYELEPMCAQIAAMAAEAGVAYGLQTGPIELAARAWLETGQRQQVTIAQGTLPTRGTDGSVELCYDRHRCHVTGEVPTAALPPPIGNVPADTLLARRRLATAGADGSLVTGEPIPAPRGAEAPLAIKGPITATTTEDATHVEYRAAQDAILEPWTNDQLTLTTHKVFAGDLKASAIPIEAWGDLTIQGAILPHVVLKVRGALHVQGAVEHAYVEAAGDVTIDGGIFGEPGGIEVRSGGSITARFAQNARITAAGDIHVSDATTNSILLAQRHIEVCGQRGLVRTSQLVAGRTIRATVVGSAMESSSELTAGHDPAFWQFAARVTRDLYFLHRQTAKGFAHAHRWSVRDRQRLETQLKRKRVTGLIIERILERRQRAIQRDLAESENRPRVRIDRDLFPNIRVRIGTKTLVVRDPQGRGLFVLAPNLQEVLWISQ